MIKHILVLCISIILFMGCQGKQGPVGPSLTGDINGRVQLIDSTANTGNQASVLIQLEGTQYSSSSDSTGLWKLSGVQTGTYAITCSKPGYSTAKNTSFQFIGGIQPTNAGYFYLYLLPSRYVKTLNTPQLNQNTLTIAGKLSSIPTTNSAQLVFTYVGFDSSATTLSAKYLTYADNFVQTTDTFSAQFDVNSLRTLGVKSGSKLYFVGFTVVSTSAGYYDVVTQQFVFTGLCLTPSNIVSFIVP